ncbi:MAG: hypothetical protein IKR12_00750 [Clostridia bacterium]|nr:hypothetical protein [Clostridia bacterium]
MDFGSAVLNVLAVIGIIIVAGLVIYLLAALVVSILDKKEVKPFKSNEESKAEEQEEQRLLLENRDYQLSFDDEKKEEPKEEEAQEEPKEVGESIDLDLADEEKKQIEERQRVVNSNVEEVEEEPEEEDDLEAMYAKLINDINSEATEEEPEEVEEEPVEEPVAEEPAKEEPTVDEEKEALKAQLAELQSKNAELAKQLEEKPAVETVETESLESLLARKAVLEERLSASEKELKANKKEYVPLSRIKKNLESDKAKLRRKEAVVAKQKVVLFGVNNYVVDPEKEKKLSEDLDVLDALRLSVQHCEEVMKENEDRYPILEKTNGILTKQVEELKSDIADLDARIAKLQGEDNGADAE